MKNNFKKNGNMRVRYETTEERREILRILEEQRGFRIDKEQKKVTKIHPMNTRTFDINLKFKTIEYDTPRDLILRIQKRVDELNLVCIKKHPLQWNFCSAKRAGRKQFQRPDFRYAGIQQEALL